MLARVGFPVKEDFTVVGPDQQPVESIPTGDFTVFLYDPDGSESSGTVPVTLTELGDGDYRASFTPDADGEWYLRIVHDIYFPWGKADTIQAYDASIDSIAIDVEFIRSMQAGRWKIESNQMIFYDEDNTTEVARFNLLDKNGQPAMVNVYERQKV